MGDVAEDLEILRARTLEPGYGVKQAVWQTSVDGDRPGLGQRVKGALIGAAKSALIPDPQVLWVPDASRVLARRLAGTSADEVVFITAPPFSQFFLDPWHACVRAPAVVLDYRDEWITYRSSYEMMGRLGSWIGGPMEKALVRSAHAITTATEAFRENLLTQFPFLDPGRVVAIPNGYDPDDFPRDLPAPRSDRFVITYAGTVFKLTSPRGFLEAIRLVHQREPALAALLDVRFIGRVVTTEESLFGGTEELGVTRLGFMDKPSVIRELGASHLVLCTLDDVEGNERIYPRQDFRADVSGPTLSDSFSAGGPVRAGQPASARANHWSARSCGHRRLPDRAAQGVSQREGSTEMSPRRHRALPPTRASRQFRDVFADAISRARRSPT